jgi:hypothetical protein
MQATAELDSIVRIHASSRLSLPRVPCRWPGVFAEPAAWTAQDHTQAVVLIDDSPKKAQAYTDLAIWLRPLSVWPLSLPRSRAFLGSWVG